MNFLNQNAGALTVVFSFIVALSTLIYAILTWKLVSETRSLRKAQTEPQLSVLMIGNEAAFGFYDLLIKNIGNGPAFNVTFEISPDFEYASGRTLSNIGMFKRGIRYLAPQQEFRTFLTRYTKEVKDLQINFLVKYSNSLGEELCDQFLIEFAHFENICRLGSSPLHKIADKIEKIQEDLHRITSGFSRIKTVIFTQEDLRREREELEKLHSGDK